MFFQRHVPSRTETVKFASIKNKSERATEKRGRLRERRESSGRVNDGGEKRGRERKQGEGNGLVIRETVPQDGPNDSTVRLVESEDERFSIGSLRSLTRRAGKGVVGEL